MTEVSRTSYEPAPPDTPVLMAHAQEFTQQEHSRSGEGGLGVLLCAALVLLGPLVFEWWVHLQNQGGAPW